ncbi:MAG: UDP-galactose-4-epimerase [Methanocella sp. PtaU1.Bin125]|nr:MAG: UDP-galactose-4-epimerase [Methanocella sp. PtaU1.Bin125]
MTVAAVINLSGSVFREKAETIKYYNRMRGIGMIMKCVVTGGAGFIGSHLVDALLAAGHEVTVVDNLSSGKREFLEPHMGDRRFRLVEADLSGEGYVCADFKGADTIFHLAANPDVRTGATDTKTPITQNVMATYNVLESMRLHGVSRIAFTSTSTVYGEALVVPTPEDYGPLLPISLYGASKLSCEALISSYCHTFGMRAWIYRFANIVGDRGTHGVIFDFIKKLRASPKKLTILGDGRQSKSYLHISDCVEAMLFVVENAREQVNVYNIGSDDRFDVTGIARVVAEEMGLNGVAFEYTGGDRGWKGDVPFMALSIEKIRALGWKPTHDSGASVRLCVQQLLKEA